MPVTVDAGRLGVTAEQAKADPRLLARANFQGVVQDAVDKALGDEAEVVSADKEGGPDDASFLAVYRRNGQPVAVLGVDQPRMFTRWRRQLPTTAISV